jgi:hypothetical protein
MKKQILSLLTLFVCYTASAQFDYHSKGRWDAPVLGMEWGLTGGGYTAMQPNRDDMEADQRLDPQMMNFTYAAGVEGIYWFQKSVGFGGQLLLWNSGAVYTGKDTLTKLDLNATTKMTYLKLPLLFHFKSYNRYYPNRRTRFSAMFGPYVALMSSFSDEVTLSNAEFNIKTTSTIDNQTISSPGVQGKINGKIYKPFDLGFTFGVGGELRLWKRTVVALQIRTDLGFFDIEDKRDRKVKYDNNPLEYDFKYWDGLYSKYNTPNILDNLAGFQANRPATKNFSVGAFLSLRKYFRQ